MRLDEVKVFLEGKFFKNIMSGNARQAQRSTVAQLTTTVRDALISAQRYVGLFIYNTTAKAYQWWNGTTWENMSRPYKVYTGLLTQAGTAIPTAVEQENSIGVIAFARTGVGVYTATLATAFTAGKTVIFINQPIVGKVAVTLTSTSVNTINTYDAAGTLADVILLNTSFEVRVYN